MPAHINPIWFNRPDQNSLNRFCNVKCKFSDMEFYFTNSFLALKKAHLIYEDK